MVIEWIDKVCSTRYQRMKISASTMAKTVVETEYAMLMPTWATSAHMVPNTLTMTTQNQ